MSDIFDKSITIGDLLALAGGIVFVALPLMWRWWHHANPIKVGVAITWSDRIQMLVNDNWHRSVMMHPLVEGGDPIVDVRVALRAGELYEAEFSIGERKWFCREEKHHHRVPRLLCWQYLAGSAIVIGAVLSSTPEWDAIKSGAPAPDGDESMRLTWIPYPGGASSHRAVFNPPLQRHEH